MVGIAILHLLLFDAAQRMSVVQRMDEMGKRFIFS